MMRYEIMRLRKYYDAFRTNKPFLKIPLSQKAKIFWNILKFFKSNAKKSLVLSNKPVTAQIEPTSKCNLKCEFCVRKKTGVPIGTMSFGDFKRVLKKLDCLFKLHLSGQGEPFLNPDIFKMIKYANKKGIVVNTTSNGTVLTKSMIDRICGVEIGEISVSVDSTKKRVYENIRKGAKFEKVMNNIKNLTSKLNNEKKKMIVSFAVVIFKDNLDDIPKFVNLAEKAGVRKIIFQTLQKKEDYINKYNKKSKAQALSNLNSKIKEKIGKARRLAAKKNISIIFDEGKSFGCLWPWRGIYITWDGYVTVCCKILNYKNPLIGNLLREDFWKIWNNEKYQIFRRLLRGRKAPFACKGCSMV